LKGKDVRRRLLSGIAAAILAGAMALFATPQPALAAATQTICTSWTNSQVWQTSTSWSRVRDRLCLEYTAVQVRARTQFQVDWPSECSITIGIPPTVTGGCPVSRFLRAPNNLFLSVQMHQGWMVGSGKRVNGTCTSSNWNAMRSAQSTYTKTCVGGWAPRKRLVEYRVYLSVAGDIWADNDGFKQLDEVTASWHWG
jgi:hypothetical protein